MSETTLERAADVSARESGSASALARNDGRLVPVSVAALTLLVFLVDLATPNGIAVWVFYLAPLALCLLGSQPALPIVTAFAQALLIAAGHGFTDGWHSQALATMNRMFGVATTVGVALLVRQALAGRLLARRTVWLRDAQADLARAAVGEQDLDSLADGLLRTLARRLGADGGALYFLEAGVLRRHAAFAPAPGAQAPPEFAIGSGIVGRVAYEGRTVEIDVAAAVATADPTGDADAAAEAAARLRVAGAAGQWLPRRVVATPLTADGRVCGVVELGLMHPIGEHGRDLLALVSEPAGVALRAAKYRDELQALLAQTQRQTEQLQTQQEELRVSNEELEEQGRALMDSQARLENQQAELEQTNALLEERTEWLERQKRELLDTQQELQRNAAALERANRYKSEFLANMSHELRTPLNSSLILAKLLAENRQKTLSEEQVRYAKTIHAANADLLTLINDILDLARIEAGRVEIQPERVPLERVLEPLRQIFDSIAAERRLALHFDVADDAPRSLVTDAQRVSQVLRNLLANAFKFTERGGVTLRVRPRGASIEFAVIDTGIGIAPEQQQVIFEAFRQADGTTNRRFGGTGLGLSISRELANLLGGRISVDSRPGEGSTFSFVMPVQHRGPSADAATSAHRAPAVAADGEAETMRANDASGARRAAAGVSDDGRAPPVAPPHEVAAPLPVIDDDRDRRRRGDRLIVVVEDDLAFARILYDLINELDFDCVHASSASEGLRLVRELKPCAVLLDVGLPDHSGLSVLESLKRDPETRPIPVHIVSVDDYAQNALALGAIGFAQKPLDREQITAAIRKLETKSSQQVKRILVVEDDENLRQSITALLAAEDIEIIGVGSVADAIARLGETTFDCLVLDLVLPDASGYDLLERMSAGDAHSFPPVIVYTGRALGRDEEQRLRRYSRSIIVKGARSPERLLDEVTLFLHQVESRLPPERQRMLLEARQRDAAFDGRRILLAEDDVRNIFALSSVLEPLGATVVIARNGREAIEALEREPAVDLVLMDIMMPEMDGLAAMAEIRRRAQWARLPIIALTAKAMRDDRERCLKAGASDYIAKPLDVDRLLSLCRVWMPR